VGYCAIDKFTPLGRVKGCNSVGHVLVPAGGGVEFVLLLVVKNDDNHTLSLKVLKLTNFDQLHQNILVALHAIIFLQK